MTLSELLTGLPQASLAGAGGLPAPGDVSVTGITLDSRLVRAVRDVCGTASDADLEGQNAVRACREQTLAQARGRGALLVAAVSSGETLAITAAR